MLLQGDLDEAEATVNELNNEIPRQQDILEQVIGSLPHCDGCILYAFRKFIRLLKS